LLSHTVLQRPTTPTYGCATITPNHEQFKLPHVTLRVLAACVVLLACLALPAGTQDLVTPSDRVSSHVNIRAEADEDAPEIGQLEIGQALPLVGSAPRFYQVQLPAGQTGFVSKSFTTNSAAPDVLISSAGNRFFHPRCASTERFTSLATTKRHDIRCGTPSEYVTSRTNRAHYVTEVGGAVIVTSSGRSPVTVNCTRSVECGVKIAH